MACPNFGFVFFMGRKCFLSKRGNTVFLCFSLDFLGEAKKSGFWGESGFFYWGFGGMQAVKAGIFLHFLLHIGERYAIQAIQLSIQSKLLTIQVFPYRHPQKQTTNSRSAQILQISIAKHHVAAGTNDHPPNNEKRTIPAQQPD